MSCPATYQGAKHPDMRGSLCTLPAGHDPEIPHVAGCGDPVEIVLTWRDPPPNPETEEE